MDRNIVAHAPVHADTFHGAHEYGLEIKALVVFRFHIVEQRHGVSHADADIFYLARSFAQCP